MYLSVAKSVWILLELLSTETAKKQKTKNTYNILQWEYCKIPNSNSYHQWSVITLYQITHVLFWKPEVGPRSHGWLPQPSAYIYHKVCSIGAIKMSERLACLRKNERRLGGPQHLFVPCEAPYQLTRETWSHSRVTWLKQIHAVGFWIPV